MHYDKLQQSSILRKLYSFDFPLLAFVDELSADFVAVLKSNTGYSQLPNMDSLRNAKLLAHPLWGFNFSGRADKCFFLQIPPKRYLSFQAKIALICPPIPFPHSAEANMLRHLRRKLNSPAMYLLNRCVCRHINRLTHHPSETQLGKMEIQHNLFWGRIEK